MAERRATWEQDGVMVRRCSMCGGVKPLEAAFYISRPRVEGPKRWRYMCMDCEKGPEQRAKHAVWKREWARRNPELEAAANKRYLDKLKADPERYAVHLENCRIAYRLRQERDKGRSLDDIRQQRAHHPLPADDFGRLPALPLALALESYARRGAIPEENACELAGIDPRNLFAWRTGERELVLFDVADRVLTRLGLSWWDVWDENDPAVRAVWERQVAA